MRISDLDFILVPDWSDPSCGGLPDGDHWISRWHRNITTAEWFAAEADGSADALISQIGSRERQTMVITHGRGVDVLLHAGRALGGLPVAGAFIVAPSPTYHNNQSVIELVDQFQFASVVVSSEDHPEFHPDLAQKLSDRLGGHFVNAGASGRIDSLSGQGPWPEGLMRLGWFLKQLSAD